MLPAAARLRRRTEFSSVVRQGRRAARGPLVLHLVRDASIGPARAGFVVSRAVGPAVQRNAVRRRLRELVRTRLGDLPPGSGLVVRAQPGATTMDSTALGRCLDAALAAVGDPA